MALTLREQKELVNNSDFEWSDSDSDADGHSDSEVESESTVDGDLVLNQLMVMVLWMVVALLVVMVAGIMMMLAIDRGQEIGLISRERMHHLLVSRLSLPFVSSRHACLHALLSKIFSDSLFLTSCYRILFLRQIDTPMSK